MYRKVFIGFLLILLTVSYGRGIRGIIHESDAGGRSVPKMLNYQGYLTDTDGIPIDDILDMRFRILDALTSGTELWTEDTTGVSVERGIFNALLGSVNPIPDSVFTGGIECWLEVTLEGSATLTPRTRITSTGYAYMATHADTAEYAKIAMSDNDWIRGPEPLLDTVLFTANYLGIARGGAGNVLYGDNDGDYVYTHTNLGGYACTTGVDTAHFSYMTISGGYGNCAQGEYSFIGGGEGNSAIGYCATISGGSYNTVNTVTGDECYCVTIGGGEGNSILSNHSYVTIGGGGFNTADEDGATISGGSSNTATGYASTICGGEENSATRPYAVVAGGKSNTVQGEASFVGGGKNDTVSGDFSFIGGGLDNYIRGDYSFIGGGNQNIVDGDYSVILCGDSSIITDIAHHSFLFGFKSKLTQDSTFMIDLPHIRFGDETSGYEFPTTAGSADQVMITDVSGYLSWVDVPADIDWTISGDNMSSGVSGSVGIGIAASQSKLGVHGGVSIGASYAGTASPANGMIIEGNVGIGTDDPDYTLDVAGSAGFDDYLCHNDDVNTYLSFLDDQIALYAGAIQMIKVYVHETEQDIVVINEAGVDVDFRVESNSEANALFVQGSDGKVGIGTLSPAEKLDVDGTVKMTGFKLTPGATVDYVLTTSASGVGTWQATQNDSDWDISGNLLYPSAEYGLSMRSTNVLYGTNDSTHVNFGIACTTGTSAQNYKYCTVAGGYGNAASGDRTTVGGGENNTASDSFATVGGGYHNIASGYAAVVVGGKDNLVEADYSVILGGYADTITANADSSCLLGIGSKLTAASTFMVDMPHIRFGDEASGYEFPTTAGSDDQVMVISGTGQLSWTDFDDDDWTISGDDMYSTVSGKVGIGTSSPDYTLDVAGSAGFDDYLYHNDDNDTYLYFSNDRIDLYAGNVQMITSDVTAQDIVVINEAGVDVDFRVESANDENALFVDGSDDKVGIGTSSPGEKLDVVGTVQMTGFKMSASPTSGYVLTSDASGGGSWELTQNDNDWDISGNLLYPSADYGLSMRSANVLYGTNDSTHVNFGIACTTGTSAQNYKYCTVAGGYGNTAGGDYSFAAGRRAKAIHSGTFVWADDEDADFTTTGNGQFLIRAAGGVGIGTDDPDYTLDVAGSAGFDDYLYHNDDNDTYLSFLDDQIDLYAGGIQMITCDKTITQDVLVINEAGADVDFRVESDDDENALFVHGIDGNVGIGTSSPVQELEVNGTVQMSGFKLTTGGGADYVLTTDGSGDGSWAAIPPDADWIISVDDMYSAVTGNVGIGIAASQSKLGVHGGVSIGVLYTGTASPTNGMIIEGNVGIGTDDPDYALDVAGSAGFDDYLYHNDDDNDTYLSFLDDQIDLYAGGIQMITCDKTITQDVLVINEAGADVDFRVESDDDENALFVHGIDGNVGIGTSSPVQELEVNGTVQMSGFKLTTGGAEDYVLTTNGSGIGTWQATQNDGDWTISGIDMYSGVTGKVGIGSSSPGSKLSIDGGVSIGNSYAGTASPANGMIIEGKVGVGTLSPDYALDVAGSAGFDDYLYHNDDNDTYLSFLDNQIDLYAGGIQMIKVHEHETEQDIVVINEAGVDVDFRVESVGEANALFVQGSDGNVGIGTSSPVQELEVNGTVQMSGFKLTTGGAADHVLTTDGSGDGSWAAIPPDDDWTISGDDMYSTVSGKVGIGTSSPTYTLDIAGTAGFDDYLYHNDDNDTYLSFLADQIDLYAGGIQMIKVYEHETEQDIVVINEAGVDVDFRVESVGEANALFVQGSDGNVGIGTSSPVQELEVNGTVQMSGFKLTPGGTNGHVLTTDGSGVGTWQEIPPDGDWTISGIDMYSGVTGKVGIGSSSPGSKLSIDGGVSIGNSYAGTASPTNGMIIEGNVGIGTNNPNYKLDVAGSAGFDDYLYHNDDANTYLSFLDNQIDLYAGGIQMITVYEHVTEQDIVVINEAGVDVDFRVESVGEANALFVQGSDGKVGIGIATSGSKLGVNGGVSIGASYAGTASPANGMIIEGNVGIGTSSPDCKLDVADTIQMTYFKMPTNSTSGYVLTSDASGVGTWQSVRGELAGVSMTAIQELTQLINEQQKRIEILEKKIEKLENGSR